MTKVELQEYRRALRTLGSRLHGDLTHLAGEVLMAGGRRAGSGPDLLELGTAHCEQEVTAGLLRAEGNTLEEIAAALARIDDGTFGACEECQEPIALARLEALPYARHCIACARKLERKAG